MRDNAQPDIIVSAEDYARLCDFLYRHTGMTFTETKRYYVERRLVERIVATEAGSFFAYFVLLRAAGSREVEQLINSITVNETYFYREDHQFRCLTNSLLDPIAAAKRPGRPIRIWSAPCSTGEEPYSVAIWLLENWPKVDAYEVEIVGSDIDTNVLAAARAGVYERRALGRLPADLASRYFDAAGADRWQIIKDLRDSVRFTTVNLADPAAARGQGVFDVIFCRNMLIYFDEASRRVAAENLYEALLPGGYLLLGHTESMSRISPLFQLRRFPDAILYQRPGAQDG